MQSHRGFGLIAMVVAALLWAFAAYLLTGGRREVRWRGSLLPRGPWAGSFVALGAMLFLQALPEFILFSRHTMQLVRFASVLCLPACLLLQRRAWGQSQRG